MNPDSDSLAREAEESLQVASELHSSGHYDFAVSRAYYAMYYVAEAVLLEKGEAFSSHRSVHNGFFHRFVEADKLERKYHQSLVSGFQLRQTGDYGGFTSIPEDESEDLLERATEFVTEVRMLLGTDD